MADNDLKKKLTSSITTLAWYHQKSKSCLLRNSYLSGAKKKKKTKDKEKQGDDADKIENDNVLFPTILNSLESKRLHILYCNAKAEER